jgi:hypothetical protein
MLEVVEKEITHQKAALDQVAQVAAVREEILDKPEQTDLEAAEALVLMDHHQVVTEVMVLFL